MEQNPSIVNDLSGNNYNIGEGVKGGLVEAQMSYLENLSNLVQKRPLYQQQYFPGYDQGLAAGNVSGSIIGNQPIFATGGGLIPFGILDEMERAKAESEQKYYEQIKKELDEPLSSQKAVAADPFMQPEFSQKVMDITDKYLSLYTQRLGGDVAKAYVATKYDKNFQKEMQVLANYADMYNSVYKEAMEIKKEEVEHPDMVLEDAKKAADMFLHNHDYVKDYSPDKLKEVMNKVVKTFSVTKLAESLTSGIKDTTKESIKTYTKGSAKISTAYEKVNEGVADDIINNAKKAYPDLAKDPERLAVFERAVKARVNSSTKSAISELDEEAAKRNAELRKNGILFDDKGNMQFSSRPTAVVSAIGTKAVSYPKTDPVPSYSGMTGWIRHEGQLKQVRLPESYNMQFVSEYDINDKNSGIPTDRYVECRIDFKSTQPYENPTLRKGTSSYYNVNDLLGVEGKTTTQTVPVKLEIVGNIESPINVLGANTLLVPYDQVKTMIEANVNHMKDVHDELEKQPVENTYKTSIIESRLGKRAVENNIMPFTNDTDPNEIDSDQLYNINIPGNRRNGEVISGKDLLEMWKIYSK